MEWLKSHKLWVLGGAAVIAVLYVVTRGGGASSSSSGTTGDVAAASALQAAQLQASAQGQQISAASQAQSQQTAAQLEIAKLQIAQSGAHDALAAQVATSQINASQQLQSLLGSLSADVTNKQTQAQVAINASNVGGTVAMQQILANALVQQSTNQANVAIAGYTATEHIAATNAGAAQAISASHDEHSGGLFGGGGFLGLGI